MQVTLTSKNHNREHSFNLVVREHEIVLTTPDGEEFATLQVETSENDVLQDDSYKTVPTNCFFLNFCPARDSRCDKGSAWVNVKEEVNAG